MSGLCHFAMSGRVFGSCKLILHLKNLCKMFDSETLIRYGGLLLLFLAVFCQTGLFFCFFIPSGGLLFTAGVFIATGNLPGNVFTNCSLLIIASFLGNITGYGFGIKAGPIIYKRKESWFFKRKHLAAAELFYKKKGKYCLSSGIVFSYHQDIRTNCCWYDKT